MVPQNDSSYSLCEGLTARVSNQSFDKFNLHHNWEYKKRHIAIKMHLSLLVSCSLKLMAVSIKIWAWKFRISEIRKLNFWNFLSMIHHRYYKRMYRVRHTLLEYKFNSDQVCNFIRRRSWNHYDPQIIS